MQTTSRVVNCQKKMEVFSRAPATTYSDDFQLSGNFDELVSLARSNVSTLRHLHYANKNARKRKLRLCHSTREVLSDFTLILPGFHMKERFCGLFI